MVVAIGNVNQLFGDPQAVMGTELILRIAEDFASVTGGLYESWEFNADGTEQTLYLRKGLRVTLNTDNTLFARTSPVQELRLAVDTYDLTLL